MESKIKAVELFHNSFGLGVSHEPVANLGKEKNQLRFNLMDEENKEYLEAANEGDLIEVADALGDSPLRLAFRQHGVDDAARVVNADVFENLHHAVLLRHLHHRYVGGEGVGALRQAVAAHEI